MMSAHPYLRAYLLTSSLRCGHTPDQLCEVQSAYPISCQNQTVVRQSSQTCVVEPMVFLKKGFIETSLSLVSFSFKESFKIYENTL